MRLFFQFPPLPQDELKSEMEYLEKSSLSTVSDEQLRHRLGRIYNPFQHLTKIIKAGQTTIRWVPVLDRPSNVSQISHIPHEMAKEKAKMGRVNRDGETVFYGSSHALSGLSECRPKEGALFAVGWWLVTNPIEVIELGYASAAAAAARQVSLSGPPNESERNN